MQFAKAQRWWRQAKSANGRRQSRSKDPFRRRPVLERLEDRTLLAVNFFSSGATPGPVMNVDAAIAGLAGGRLGEANVAVDPNNPNVIAFSSQSRLLVSNDDGNTFLPAAPAMPTFFTPPPTLAASGNNGDTSTAFDRQGRLFWTNLVQAGMDTGGNQTSAVCVEQIDPTTGAQLAGTATANVSQNNPTLNQDDDRQVLAADSNPASPNANNRYLAWTRFTYTYDTSKTPPVKTNTTYAVMFSAWTPATQAWSPPISLSVAGEGFVHQITITVGANPDPVLGNLGDVFVAYHSQTGSGTDGNPDGKSGRVFLVRSTNGGATFPQKTSPFGAGQADITFNDQAYKDAKGNVVPATRTLPGARFLTQGSTTPYVLASAGTLPGVVYVVAANDPNHGKGGGTDQADIVMAISVDNGQTWPTRLTVAAGPTDLFGNPTPTDTFRLFPTAAIDKSGNIIVAWYGNDRLRKNSSGDYLLDVYGKYSTNGGFTWTNQFRINSTDNGGLDPFNGAPIFPQVPSPPSTYRIGEYFGLGLFGGTAYVAWTGNSRDSSGNINGQQINLQRVGIPGSITVTDDNTGVNTSNTIRIEPVTGTGTGLGSNDLQVRVNGNVQYAGVASSLKTITVDESASAANDTVRIEPAPFRFGISNLDALVIVNMGTGTDTVQISPIARKLDNYMKITVNGKAGGVGTLQIFDQNDLGTIWDVTATTLSTPTYNNTFGYARTFTYSLLSVVQLSGPSVANTYDVRSTSTATTNIETGEANDTVNVQATSGQLNLTNRGGNDTVTIGSPPAGAKAGFLNNILASIDVSDIAGGTNVILDDSQAPQARTATITDHSIAGLFGLGGSLTYTAGLLNCINCLPSQLVPGVNSITIYGGPKGNTFNVLSTPTGPVNIFAGPNNDFVIASASFAHGGSVLNLIVFGNGQHGVLNTTLILDDATNSNSPSFTTLPTYLITDKAVTRSDVQQTGTNPPVTVVSLYQYSDLAALVLNGGLTHTEFDIQSTAKGTPVTITAGPSNDAVIAGYQVNLLVNIAQVTVTGSTGTTFTLNDQNNANKAVSTGVDGLSTSPVYLVKSSQVTRTDTRVTIYANGNPNKTDTVVSTFSYSNLAGLTINGGSSQNVFNVQSTSAPVTIYAGIGNDAVNAGAPSGLLDGIGTLTVNGSTGTILTLDDHKNANVINADGSGSTTSPSYVLTDTKVTRTNAVTLTIIVVGLKIITPYTVVSTFNFSNLAGLVMVGGTSGNAFSIQNTAASPPVKIDGGAGTNLNSLIYSAYTAGDVTVNLALDGPTATGISNGIVNFQSVTGGPGNNLLVGGPEANYFTGGAGRNILIGGKGADQLFAVGTTSENILIGGYTAYDKNPAALDLIFQEWKRTDLTFRERYDDIRSGGTIMPAKVPDSKLKGTGYMLVGKDLLPGQTQTVLDDGAANTLYGNGVDAKNWFFYGGADLLFLDQTNDKKTPV